jgi:hypothetical protein
MFNKNLLDELKISDTINLANLEASDKFFNAMKIEFVYFLVVIYVQ